jgi:hypothetical protein
MPNPPIVVISFNRPDYLRQVLHSLAAQEGGAIEGRDVLLFQDGWRSPHSGRRAAEPEAIAASIAVFREIFPRGEVFAAVDNLGVAEMFRTAEHHVFEDRGAEVAYFFEDDLVLAPRYLRVLDGLRDAAAGNPGVAYFAAYGEFRASAERQRARPRDVIAIEHHWAFGLFREHWRRMQPFLDAYYAMLVGRDYRDRPHAEIIGRFREQGLPAIVSSQDGIKQAISFHLGAVGLNTYAVHGRYVGEKGEHFTPHLFEQAGYGRTEMLTEHDGGFDFPDDAQLAALHERALTVRRTQVWRDSPDSPAASGPDAPPLITALRRPPAELAFLSRIFASGLRRYAEFGAGNSTLLAIRSPLERIVSVETDGAWAERVRGHGEIAAALASGRASLLHADIGPTGPWGEPTDPASRARWPDTLRTMWAEWARRGALPDIVFADGRFRVASALSSWLACAAEGEPAPLLLFQDLSAERAGYRAIFEAYERVETVGAMCLARARRDVSPAAVLELLLARLHDAD